MCNIFVKHCKEKNIAFDPKTITKGELNQLLRTFYVEVRKEDGTLYQDFINCGKVRIAARNLNISCFPVDLKDIRGPMHAAENVGTG